MTGALPLPALLPPRVPANVVLVAQCLSEGTQSLYNLQVSKEDALADTTASRLDILGAESFVPAYAPRGVLSCKSNPSTLSAQRWQIICVDRVNYLQIQGRGK